MSVNSINEFGCFFLAFGELGENLIPERDAEGFPASKLHQYSVRLTSGDTQDLFYFFSTGFGSEAVAFCLKPLTCGDSFREFV